MGWLRRLLGMPEPMTPPHVQAAIDSAQKADEAFTDVNEAVRDYKLARATGNKARDIVIADYLAAEKRRART